MMHKNVALRRLLTKRINQGKSLRRFHASGKIGADALDMPDTFADVKSLVDDIGYRPKTGLEEGVRAFVGWYGSYYA